MERRKAWKAAEKNEGRKQPVYFVCVYYLGELTNVFQKAEALEGRQATMYQCGSNRQSCVGGTPNLKAEGRTTAALSMCLRWKRGHAACRRWLYSDLNLPEKPV